MPLLASPFAEICSNVAFTSSSLLVWSLSNHKFPWDIPMNPVFWHPQQRAAVISASAAPAAGYSGPAWDDSSCPLYRWLFVIISLFPVFFPLFQVLFRFSLQIFKFAPLMNCSGFFQNFIKNALFDYSLLFQRISLLQQ